MHENSDEIQWLGIMPGSRDLRIKQSNSLQYFLLLFRYMQKHQQWLDNRNYEHHLKCLQKIKEENRKYLVHSAVHKKGRSKRLSQRQLSEEEDKTLSKQKDQVLKQAPRAKKDEKPSHRIKSVKKQHISVKEKELLWDNFLFGKRILETSPVISVKKHEDEYKKYKKLLEQRTQRNKKQTANSQFRNSKLREYAENTYRITNCFRLPTAGRNQQILTLKVREVRLNRQKTLPFEDIVIKYRMQGKTTVQTSQIINVDSLAQYQFYFRLGGLKFNKENISKEMIFQLYEIKGLKEQLIGYFLVSRQELGNRQPSTRMFLRAEKTIGEVDIQVYSMKKSLLKSSL